MIDWSRYAENQGKLSAQLEELQQHIVAGKTKKRSNTRIDWVNMDDSDSEAVESVHVEGSWLNEVNVVSAKIDQDGKHTVESIPGAERRAKEWSKILEERLADKASLLDEREQKMRQAEADAKHAEQELATSLAEARRRETSAAELQASLEYWMHSR